jgi:hypothetical protein
MELISKELYHAGFGTLNVGESTAGRDISEEIKEQMLKDHPDWFEVAGEEAAEKKEDEQMLKDHPDWFEVAGEEAAEKKEDELKIETPEDSLVIETPEAKMDKPRKK